MQQLSIRGGLGSSCCSRLWIWIIGLITIVAAQSRTALWESDGYTLYKVGYDFKVGYYSNNNEQRPSATFLSSSTYSESLAVVRDVDSYSYSGVNLAIVYDSSTSEDFSITGYVSQRREYVPRIATYGSNQFVVTWGNSCTFGNKDYDNFTNGNSSYVYAQLFYNTNSFNGDKIIVNSPDIGQSACPSVGGFSSSGFVVVWDYHDNSSMYSEDRIYAQRFDSSGYRINTEIDVSRYGYGNKMTPSIATFPSGDFVVAWANSVSNDPFFINIQRFNSYGDRVGYQNTAIMFSDTVNQFFPSVAVLSSGKYVVIWQDYGGHSVSRRIRGQLYDSQDSSIGYEFVVNTDNYEKGTNTTIHTDGRDICQVAALKSGGFIVVWAVDISNGNGYEVYGQIFDDNAEKIGKEFNVNTYGYNDRFYPSVAVSSSGLIAVVWQEYGRDNTGMYSIYGQYFELVESDEKSDGVSSTTIIIIVVSIVGAIITAVGLYFLYTCQPKPPNGMDTKV